MNITFKLFNNADELLRNKTVGADEEDDRDLIDLKIGDLVECAVPYTDNNACIVYQCRVTDKWINNVDDRGVPTHTEYHLHFAADNRKFMPTKMDILKNRQKTEATEFSKKCIKNLKELAEKNNVEIITLKSPYRL